MSENKWPLLALMVALLVHVVVVLTTQTSLPERVATHFDGAGRANGWMTRHQHVTFMLLFGPGISGFMAGVFYLVRLFPSSRINLPRRAYWTSPEQLPRTHAWLWRHGLWMSTLVLVFLTGMHLLIVQANTRIPASLNLTSMFLLLGLFLASIAGWIIRMLVHFSRDR